MILFQRSSSKIQEIFFCHDTRARVSIFFYVICVDLEIEISVNKFPARQKKQ